MLVQFQKALTTFEKNSGISTMYFIKGENTSKWKRLRKRTKRTEIESYKHTVENQAKNSTSPQSTLPPPSHHPQKPLKADLLHACSKKKPRKTHGTAIWAAPHAERWESCSLVVTRSGVYSLHSLFQSACNSYWNIQNLIFVNGRSIFYPFPWPSSRNTEFRAFIM